MLQAEYNEEQDFLKEFVKDHVLEIEGDDRMLGYVKDEIKDGRFSL